MWVKRCAANFSCQSPPLQSHDPLQSSPLLLPTLFLPSHSPCNPCTHPLSHSSPVTLTNCDLKPPPTLSQLPLRFRRFPYSLADTPQHISHNFTIIQSHTRQVELENNSNHKRKGQGARGASLSFGDETGSASVFFLSK